MNIICTFHISVSWVWYKRITIDLCDLQIKIAEAWNNYTLILYSPMK